MEADVNVDGSSTGQCDLTNIRLLPKPIDSTVAEAYEWNSRTPSRASTGATYS